MLQGYARLTFQFERDGSDWIGTCVELGTSTFGRYRSRVQRDLTQLVTEYINVLEEDGTRERIFRENNITTLTPVEGIPHDYSGPAQPENS